MLVKRPSSRFPVGIAVTQWHIDGLLRTFILLPFTDGTSSYAEVDCNIEETHPLQVIAEPVKAWGQITNGFGDNSVGYVFSDEAADAMYWVWDDGGTVHPDKSQNLYTAFADIIEAYIPAATDYLAASANAIYEEQVAEAKRNGQDASIIVRPPHTFPYTS
jgi:hypothetical protein